MADLSDIDDDPQSETRPLPRRRPLPPRATSQAASAGVRSRDAKSILRQPAREQQPSKTLNSNQAMQWVTWIRAFQRKVLWIVLPSLIVLAAVRWFISDHEDKTFWIAPPLEAGAVRRMLLAEGFREVMREEDATVAWTDPDSARWLKPGGRLQRRSTLVSHLDARSDGECRALSRAAQRLSTVDVAGVRVARCFVLPHDAAAARDAMVHDEGGAALWEVEPIDRLAVDRATALDGGARPPPIVTNNPSGLPTEGVWT
eukprot:6770231-Prymnesium_polylepis.1